MLFEIKIGQKVKVCASTGYCARFFQKTGVISSFNSDEITVSLTGEPRPHFFFATELEEFASTSEEIALLNRHKFALKFL